jgi:hypothetical protein
MDKEMLVYESVLSWSILQVCATKKCVVYTLVGSSYQGSLSVASSHYCSSIMSASTEVLISEVLKPAGQFHEEIKN